MTWLKLPSDPKRPQDGQNGAHPDYRPDIDGLRAVAILAVVLFHASRDTFSGGFVGVDIFFVISGFLISSIIFKGLQRDTFRFFDFYSRRIKRIFPALIVVLAAAYVFGWFALLADEFQQLGKHMAASTGFIQNFTLWKEAGYFDKHSELKPLMHLWSLAIEEQFYVIYPLLVWAVWRLKLNVVAVLITLGLISFGMNIYEIGRDPVSGFFLPQNRFWELFAGSILAHLQMFRHQQWPVLQKGRAFIRGKLPHYLPLLPQKVIDNISATLGLLLISISVFSFQNGDLYPGWWALLPVTGAVLLIRAGAGAWINRTLLANRFMIFIGLISYPLYLWHWPIFSFARIIEFDAPSVQIRTIGMALSFLLAWLTYELIEKPLRFGGTTYWRIVILTALLAILGGLGYYTSKNGGLDFRHPAIEQEVAQFQWDETPFSGEGACKKLAPMTLPSNAACVGNKSASVYVIGDSHANSLAPGLNAAGVDALVINGSACLPLLGVAQESKVCRDIIGQVLEYFQHDTHVTTVILTFRGPLYLYGRGFNERIRVKISSSDDPSRSSIDTFRYSLAATLDALSRSGKKTILVLDQAELGFDPRSCINSRPLWLTGHEIRETCAVPRTDFDKRNNEYRHMIQEVVKDRPDVKVFDTAQQFCDANWCWAMKDGEVLYRDDDHLSIAGSIFVAKRLIELIGTPYSHSADH
jgi:peptidoglycan/LPS O-acetylase OafA/YrhL